MRGQRQISQILALHRDALCRQVRVQVADQNALAGGLDGGGAVRFQLGGAGYSRPQYLDVANARQIDPARVRTKLEVA